MKKAINLNIGTITFFLCVPFSIFLSQIFVRTNLITENNAFLNTFLVFIIVFPVIYALKKIVSNGKRQKELGNVSLDTFIYNIFLLLKKIFFGGYEFSVYLYTWISSNKKTIFFTCFGFSYLYCFIVVFFLSNSNILAFFLFIIMSLILYDEVINTEKRIDNSFKIFITLTCLIFTLISPAFITLKYSVKKELFVKKTLTYSATTYLNKFHNKDMTVMQYFYYLSLDNIILKKYEDIFQ